MNLLFEVVVYLAMLSSLPAIFLGRKQKGLLWYYACVTLVSDLCSFIEHNILHARICLRSDAYFLLEFILIGMYFNRLLFSKRWQSGNSVAIVMLSIWFVIRTATKDVYKVNWEDIGTMNLLIVFFCVAALFQVFRSVEHIRIEQSPLFIFSASYLLFISYTVLLMLFAEHFRGAPELLRRQLWGIHNVLMVLKNLSIAYVFFLQRRKITAIA